ncbi:MAG: hypothetical protein AMJ63_13385 [Myxococcales bacterium SG8_38_1]|nr:MAG: hypothetical protein AMJ63_13385 [Myxococcales bacterium SG8_38_1]
MAGTFWALPSLSADAIDPDADKILRSMSAYIGGLKAFSMNADIDTEVIMNDGQKLQLSSSANLVVERPGKFHFKRKGMLADAEVNFDGKTLTLYERNLNVYFQKEVPGTIDNAIRALEFETGVDVPGADLLFADPYAVLSPGNFRGEYIGTAFVGGVECHHLAFRKDKVDWQLWVKVGPEPLPVKQVITTKWMTGSPQFSVRVRNWNDKPQIKRDQFTFRAPKGARKTGAIAANDMGEIAANEEAK